jgi:multicomponent Na+:H+ antiporter subunit E
MSPASRAALCDAITLTAGTITVSQEGDLLCVHALDESLAEGLAESAFEEKLLKLEKRA